MPKQPSSTSIKKPRASATASPASTKPVSDKKGKKPAPPSAAPSSPKKRTAATEPAQSNKKAKAAAKKAEKNAAALAEIAAESEEEEDALKGFSEGEETDDDDSSDDDEEAIRREARTVKAADLPTVAKDEESVRRRLEKAKKKTGAKRGTIYVGHVPHGFYEDEMRSYFSQFGDVTRLRLSRNKKTGASKHYAFIEFSSSDVAAIVADTMDNYLIANRLLVCKVLPESEIDDALWVGADRKYRPVPKGRRERMKHNAEKTDDQKAKILKRLNKREEQRRKKLEAQGIEYDFPAPSVAAS